MEHFKLYCVGVLIYVVIMSFLSYIVWWFSIHAFTSFVGLLLIIALWFGCGLWWQGLLRRVAAMDDD